MMKADPAGPLFKILKWAPRCLQRPSNRFYLQTGSFKVSRTYSLTSSLSSHAPSGVQIRNNVFSDMQPGATFTWTLREETSPEASSWRTGYYDKPRSWEEKGPEPGDINSVTRRFAEQKQFTAPSMPSAKPSFLQACSAKALSLRKSAAKQRRKLRVLRAPVASPNAAQSSDSSSSTSSSSDSDDGSASEVAASSGPS